MLLNPYRFAAGPPAGKAFVGATALTAGSMSSATLSLPAGIQAGDLLCAIIGLQPNTQTITAPAGWTVAVNFDAGGGQDRRYYVATKIAGTGETSPTFNFSGSGDTAAELVVYRGVSAVTTGTPATSSYASSIAAPQITMPAEGFLLAIFYGSGGGSPLSISSAPAGMVQRANSQVSNFAQMPIYDTQVSAGATGTRTLTWNRSISPTMGLLIGLT